jgi:hypothetical protein
LLLLLFMPPVHLDRHPARRPPADDGQHLGKIPSDRPASTAATNNNNNNNDNLLKQSHDALQLTMARNVCRRSSFGSQRSSSGFKMQSFTGHDRNRLGAARRGVCRRPCSSSVGTRHQGSGLMSVILFLSLFIVVVVLWLGLVGSGRVGVFCSESRPLAHAWLATTGRPSRVSNSLVGLVTCRSTTTIVYVGRLAWEPPPLVAILALILAAAALDGWPFIRSRSPRSAPSLAIESSNQTHLAQQDRHYFRLSTEF